MAKARRTTVTVPRGAYAQIEAVARRRNRKVPAVIVDLAAEAARRELAAAKRVEAFERGLAAVFRGLSAEEMGTLHMRLRATLDR